MLRKMRKNDWSASVPACIERRFDAKSRSSETQVEIYRNAFSRSRAHGKRGRLRSSPSA